MIYSEGTARKITQYFKDKLGMRDYRNGWLKGNCPYCNKYKLGVHIDKGMANCFVCGGLGNPITLIQKLENIDTRSEVLRYLAVFEGYDFMKGPEIKATIEKPVKLPDSFRLLAFGNDPIAKLARAYIKRRGLHPINLSLKGYGFCTHGKYAGAIILPFYKGGKLIYFIARRFISLGDDKFINPTEEEFGIGKSHILYNIDALAVYKNVRIVESVFNAETWGNNTVAILGKKPSGWQITQLIKAPVKRYTLALDPDAKAEQLQLARELSLMGKTIKVLKLAEGEDVNSLGRKKILAIEKSYNFMEPTQFNHYYINEKSQYTY